MEKVEGVMRGRSIGTCVLVGAVGLLARPAVSLASIVEGPIVNPVNGNSYYVLSQGTWTQDESDAESIGGHLTTIRNAAENAWIVNNIAKDFSNSGGPNLSDVPLLIGFYDPTQNDGDGAQHAADFKWIDGEPTTYTNWYSGEPNNNLNALPGEYWTAINWDYAHNLGGPGTWNDINNTDVDYGIAEIVPEPGSLVLLAPAVIAALKVRRRIIRPLRASAPSTT